MLGCAVLHCVAPDDSDYPQEYQPGDGRHISIFMTNPSTKGLLGYGPSAFDYRSGEILMASVVLGLKSHVKIPSDFSESLFKSPDSTCCQQQLLDADDPDVMKYLSLGHCWKSCLIPTRFVWYEVREPHKRPQTQCQAACLIQVGDCRARGRTHPGPATQLHRGGGWALFSILMTALSVLPRAAFLRISCSYRRFRKLT